MHSGHVSNVRMICAYVIDRIMNDKVLYFNVSRESWMIETTR